MKKLILLLSIPIFFTCSSDSSDDSNNSNDNNVNDPIIGVWNTYREEQQDGDDNWSVFYYDENEFVLEFFADGTFIFETYGTWINNGDGTYTITVIDSEGSDINPSEIYHFYCDNNIMVNVGNNYSSFWYYQKQGYNHQECNEIQYNVN